MVRSVRRLEFAILYLLSRRQWGGIAKLSNLQHFDTVNATAAEAAKAESLFIVTKCCKLGAVGQCNFGGTNYSVDFNEGTDLNTTLHYAKRLEIAQADRAQLATFGYNEQ